MCRELQEQGIPGRGDPRSLLSSRAQPAARTHLNPSGGQEEEEEKRPNASSIPSFLNILCLSALSVPAHPSQPIAPKPCPAHRDIFPGVTPTLCHLQTPPAALPFPRPRGAQVAAAEPRGQPGLSLRMLLVLAVPASARGSAGDAERTGSSLCTGRDLSSCHSSGVFFFISKCREAGLPSLPPVGMLEV